MTSFLATVAAIVAHTPLWVWALFALVLFLGYQRTRDRTVGVWRVLLLPGVMALLAISGWMAAGLSAVPAIALGLLVGGTGGWLLERDGATRRLADGRLWLRGEWWSFVQIVLILGFRYTTSVVAAVNPALNADPTWHLGTLFVSAALSALFLGRAAARLKVYFTATPVAA